MNLLQRALCYLTRKRKQTIILFLVFLMADFMIIGNITILRMVRERELNIKNQIGSKVFLEASNVKKMISEKECDQIKELEGVSFLNRQAMYAVYPVNFFPITNSDIESKENQFIQLYGIDNSQKDGLIAEEPHYLKYGEHITSQNRTGILINKVLADASGIQIGDELTFEIESGDKVTGKVIGMFSTGNEEKQEDETIAMYRLENQIYMDMQSFRKLFKNTEYRYVSVYTDEPENINLLCKSIQDIVSKETEITTSDTLYKQMKIPLEQIERSIRLMLIFTITTAGIVIMLLQCMWMRSRKYEAAIFLSLGVRKIDLYLQIVLEVFFIFILSLCATFPLGNFFTQKIAELFLKVQQDEILLELSINIRDFGILFIRGSLFICVVSAISLLPVFITNPKDILSESEG